MCIVVSIFVVMGKKRRNERTEVKEAYVGSAMVQKERISRELTRVKCSDSEPEKSS